MEKFFIKAFSLILALVVVSCSKDKPVDPNDGGNGGGTPEEWKEIITLSVDRIFQEEEFGTAVIWLNAHAKGVDAYYIYRYFTVRLKMESDNQLYMGSLEGQPCTERKAEWSEGPASGEKVSTVVLIPQEGTFDFIVEYPRLSEEFTKSFRSKIWRITMSRTAGQWSVDELYLVPEQEE